MKEAQIADCLSILGSSDFKWLRISKNLKSPQDHSELVHQVEWHLERNKGKNCSGLEIINEIVEPLSLEAHQENKTLQATYLKLLKVPEMNLIDEVIYTLRIELLLLSHKPPLNFWSDSDHSSHLDYPTLRMIALWRDRECFIAHLAHHIIMEKDKVMQILFAEDYVNMRKQYGKRVFKILPEISLVQLAKFDDWTDLFRKALEGNISGGSPQWHLWLRDWWRQSAKL